MEGVRNISDNMTVLGKDEEEYDRRLESELERLAQVDLKLNKEKCKFRQTEMVFIGHSVPQKEIGIHSKGADALLETREHILNKKQSRSWDSLISVRNSPRRTDYWTLRKLTKKKKKQQQKNKPQTNRLFGVKNNKMHLTR